MRKQRRQFSPETKVAILKQHLCEQVPISQLCAEHDIVPTQFYQWQKQFFENGAAAFAKDTKRAVEKEAQRVASLEDRLQRKDAVIAQITEEHIQLKKDLGEI